MRYIYIYIYMCVCVINVLQLQDVLRKRSPNKEQHWNIKLKEISLKAGKPFITSRGSQWHTEGEWITSLSLPPPLDLSGRNDIPSPPPPDLAMETLKLCISKCIKKHRTNSISDRPPHQPPLVKIICTHLQRFFLVAPSVGHKKCEKKSFKNTSFIEPT